MLSSPKPRRALTNGVFRPLDDASIGVPDNGFVTLRCQSDDTGPVTLLSNAGDDAAACHGPAYGRYYRRYATRWGPVRPSCRRREKTMMTDPASGLSGASPDPSINPLVFDLLEWLALSPRPYAEVMEVWRTSCPRLTIWEDAVDLGLLTPLGRQALEQRTRRALARA
jgi:hypothetical protein